MAIHFACPSCRQPIEVDDDWAGQSAACPYCRNVVTAPAASTWPSTDIQQAAPGRPAGWPPPQPAQPGSVPPPQPNAMGGTPAWPPPPAPAYATVAPPGRGASAGWALALALTSLGLGGFAFLAWAAMLGRLATGQLGGTATREQMQAFLNKQMTAGSMPHNPVISAAFLLGAGVAVLALGVSIRAIVRRERLAMAVTACVIAALLLMCNGLMGMSMLVMTTAPVTPQ